MPDVEEIGVTPLEGDGDFRSDECVSLLKQADIVVTNPPFSLFREYIAQLVEHGKKFLIIGNMNAVTYKEVFPLIKENKVWLGPSIRSGDRIFGDGLPMQRDRHRKARMVQNHQYRGRATDRSGAAQCRLSWGMGD